LNNGILFKYFLGRNREVLLVFVGEPLFPAGDLCLIWSDLVKDGAGTGDEERILVVGATNRPQELDEAARRRLVKRLYIPLPEFEVKLNSS